MAAPSMLFVFSLFSALSFTALPAQPPLRNDGPPEVTDSSTRLQLQLRLLETKVYLLESSLDEKIRELRKKDEKIREMEEIIQGKVNSNAFVQSETEAVQGREVLGAMEVIDKLCEKNAEELVNQVIEDIILQDKLKDKLEAQARVADQKTQELEFRAEDAHGGWLSVLHSVAVHISQFQSYLVTYWNDCGRPALDVAIEKALEMKGQVESSAQLSIETIKYELIPALKKQSLEIVAYLEPNIQVLAAKTVDLYHSSKSSVVPLVFKVQEMADPHIQVAKELSKPYVAQVLMMIDEATMVTRTHLANIHIALKPYTKLLPSCRKFIKASTFYHQKVQRMLKDNRLTQSLATIELAWLLATALLALPAVLMLKLTSTIFRKKTYNKHIHSSYRYHTVPTRRRLKRAHPEK